jgi:hypothetical protein
MPPHHAATKPVTYIKSSLEKRAKERSLWYKFVSRYVGQSVSAALKTPVIFEFRDGARESELRD